MTDYGMKTKEQNKIMDDFIGALTGTFPGFEAHVVTETGYHPPSNRKVTEDDISIVMKEVHKARRDYETIDEVSPTYETERKDAYDNYMARAEKLKVLQEKFIRDNGVI